MGHEPLTVARHDRHVVGLPHLPHLADRTGVRHVRLLLRSGVMGVLVHDPHPDPHGPDQPDGHDQPADEGDGHGDRVI
jgi:hypothetical protein